MDRLATLTREICYLATRAGEKVMRFYEGGAEVNGKRTHHCSPPQMRLRTIF
jgi:hypothetical protein